MNPADRTRTTCRIAGRNLTQAERRQFPARPALPNHLSTMTQRPTGTRAPRQRAPFRRGSHDLAGRVAARSPWAHLGRCRWSVDRGVSLGRAHIATRKCLAQLRTRASSRCVPPRRDVRSHPEPRRLPPKSATLSVSSATATRSEGSTAPPSAGGSRDLAMSPLLGGEPPSAVWAGAKGRWKSWPNAAYGNLKRCGRPSRCLSQAVGP